MYTGLCMYLMILIMIQFGKGSYGGMRGSGGAASSHNPPCDHGAPSRMVQVKKDGPNKVSVQSI